MVDRKRAIPSGEKQILEQATFEEWCRRAAAHAGTLISPEPLSAEQVLGIVTHNFRQIVTHQEYRMYCRGASEHAMAMYYAALLEASLASKRYGPEAVDFSEIIKRWEKRAGEMLVLDGPAEFAATYKAVYSSKPDHQIADEMENLLGPAMAYGEQVKQEIKSRGKLALVHEQFERQKLVEMVEASYKEGAPPADAAEMIIAGAEYEKDGQDWIKAHIEDPMQEMVGLIAYADAVIAELEKQGLRPYVQKTLPQTTWRGTIEAGYAQRLAPDTVATTLLNAANDANDVRTADAAQNTRELVAGGSNTDALRKQAREQNESTTDDQNDLIGESASNANGPPSPSATKAHVSKATPLKYVLGAMLLGFLVSLAMLLSSNKDLNKTSTANTTAAEKHSASSELQGAKIREFLDSEITARELVNRDLNQQVYDITTGRYHDLESWCGFLQNENGKYRYINNCNKP